MESINIIRSGYRIVHKTKCSSRFCFFLSSRECDQRKKEIDLITCLTTSEFPLQMVTTGSHSLLGCNDYIFIKNSHRTMANSLWFDCWYQGCIFRLTCSHPVLTEDHVLKSAYDVVSDLMHNAVAMC